MDRSNDNGRMTRSARVIMNNLYEKIYDFDNLYLSYKKARKGKTKKLYVIKFEKYLERNLLDLQFELKNQFYSPSPMQTFILRDPKTRKISKADFRDRVIHHALVNILELIFEKSFIFDSYANRKGKGTLFAIQRFDKFIKEVSKNNTAPCFILKADIKHYFEEINHEILLQLIKRKISDEKVIWLIEKIVEPNTNGRKRDYEKGLPLGNLTSQFFANVYLNYFDNFVKRRLGTKYYIRYVDDFIILHNSIKRLEIWRECIKIFLKKKLKLELHPDKCSIFSFHRGADFVGFRSFYYFKLSRKRNIRKILNKIQDYHKGELSKEQLLEIHQGWQAYAKWANTFKLRKKIVKKIYSK